MLEVTVNDIDQKKQVKMIERMKSDAVSNPSQVTFAPNGSE